MFAPRTLIQLPALLQVDAPFFPGSLPRGGLCFLPGLQQGEPQARDGREGGLFPLCAGLCRVSANPSLVCLYVHHVERVCIQAGRRLGLGFVWVACGHWCEWRCWTASSTFPGWQAVGLGATFRKGHPRRPAVSF